MTRAEQRRARRELGFRNYLQRTKKAKRFLPPDPILKRITAFEYQLLMNLCHVAIYRVYRFYGVCISVRDLVDLLPNTKSTEKVCKAIQRLLELNLLAVLEPHTGSRARVLMPNPSGEAWTPPPLCSEQNGGDPLRTKSQNTKERGGSFAYQPGRTQSADPYVKRKSSEKETPPPKAQEGQGGAEGKDPSPADVVPAEVAFAAAKELFKAPESYETERNQKDKPRYELGDNFQARCAAASVDPAAIAAQQRLEEIRRARGLA